MVNVLRLYLAACVMFSTVSSAATLENENLLVGVTQGYKIDFNGLKQTMIITEMVPTSAPGVQNWTEMVTVQIFLGLKLTPAEFRARMERLWTRACPAGGDSIVSSASETG